MGQLKKPRAELMLWVIKHAYLLIFSFGVLEYVGCMVSHEAHHEVKVLWDWIVWCYCYAKCCATHCR